MTVWSYVQDVDGYLIVVGVCSYECAQIHNGKDEDPYYI